MHAGSGTETIANSTNDKISFGQVHWQVAGAGIINAGKPSVVPKRERQRFNLNTSPAAW